MSSAPTSLPSALLQVFSRCFGDPLRMQPWPRVMGPPVWLLNWGWTVKAVLTNQSMMLRRSAERMSPKLTNPDWNHSSDFFWPVIGEQPGVNHPGHGAYTQVFNVSLRSKDQIQAGREMFIGMLLFHWILKQRRKSWKSLATRRWMQLWKRWQIS